MAESMTYNGVTQCVWDHVKSTTIAQDHAVYVPPDANKGTVTTPVPLGLGKVVMDFDFNPDQAEVTYKLDSAPKVVPHSAIWDGIKSVINDGIKKCK